MKIISCILLLIPLVSISQRDIDLFGKSKNYVVSFKNKQWGIGPCDVDSKIVTYCVSDGSRISFIFNNSLGNLSDIIMMSPSIGQYSAEAKVSELISNTKLSIGVEPTYNKGTAYFMQPGVSIQLSFAASFVEGSYWVVEGYHKY